MIFARAMRQAGVALLVGLLAVSTASADIASFNAAVRSQDWKAASAAANETWPTIAADNPDRALIANEFAFAAYMAGDFPGAKAFAEQALAADGDPGLRAAASLASSLSAYRIRPGDDTRNALVAALEARAELPGADPMSLLAAGAATDHDATAGDWPATRQSAAIARRLMTAGGPHYSVSAHRFAMIEIMARFRETEDVTAKDDLKALYTTIREQMNAAPSEAHAESLASVYWPVYAAHGSVEAAVTRHRPSSKQGKTVKGDAAPPPTARDVRYLYFKPDWPFCQRATRPLKNIEFPPGAIKDRLVGSVVLLFDIDARGRTSNIRILAAAPAESFGPAAVKIAEDYIFKPGKVWDRGRCQLAHKDFVQTISFGA